MYLKYRLSRLNVYVWILKLYGLNALSIRTSTISPFTVLGVRVYALVLSFTVAWSFGSFNYNFIALLLSVILCPG